MLIFPIGKYSHLHSYVTTYSPHEHKLMHIPVGNKPLDTTSPFTVSYRFRYDENGKLIPDDILLVQTIVFTLVSIVFVVFAVLFTIELKRAGVFEKLFEHRPTKAERMQAQIDELQKQVEDLKKGK